MCMLCFGTEMCSDPCAFAQKASYTTTPAKGRCGRVYFVCIASVSSTKDEGILVPWLVSFFKKMLQNYKLPCIFHPKGLKVRLRETSYVARGKV